MINDHSKGGVPMNTMVSKIIAIVVSCGLSVFSWQINGTVRSNQGDLIPGVVVTVVDSSNLGQVVTNQSGWFQFENNGNTHFSITPQINTFSYTMSENSLIIQSPYKGLVRISLMNLKGKTLWSHAGILVNGVSQISIPRGLANQASVINISSSEGVVQANSVLYKTSDMPASLFPSLHFKKEGFADTVYTMSTDRVINANVEMRDTTTSISLCPATALSPGDHQKTIQVKGLNRNYILHVPSSYNGSQSVPLVVDFHPLGGSGSNQLAASPYKQKTDPEGVITVYPDGQKGPSGGAWNVGPCCVSSSVDDTAFTRALVEEVKKLACIDPKRVYAVGFSMGGGMSHYSACHLSDIFAAVAPAAFDLLEENQSSCKPARPIPVISFRSTGDFVVNYNGAYSPVVQGMPITFLGAQKTLEKWAQINQCVGSPITNADGCLAYENCAAGVQVALCTKTGGGHDYGDANVGWPWLKQFTLP